MEFQTLIKNRYSCRQFSDKKVEPHLIETIIEAGRIAPTAINTQPFKIFWLSSPQAKEAIRKACDYTFDADNFLLVGYQEADGWQRHFDKRNFADVDASIVATHMMLATQNLGLHTTWVAYFDVKLLQELCPQMQGYDLIALFPIGYATEDAVPSPRHFQRKQTAEILEIL